MDYILTTDIYRRRLILVCNVYLQFGGFCFLRHTRFILKRKMDEEEGLWVTALDEQA